MNKIPIGIFFCLEGIVEGKLDNIKRPNVRLAVVRSFVGDMEYHRFHSINITIRAGQLRKLSNFVNFRSDHE